MCEINWEIVVNILGIIINGFLAFWIVGSIQKKQSIEKTVKDHFITEIKGDFANGLLFFIEKYFNLFIAD